MYYVYYKNVYLYRYKTVHYYLTVNRLSILQCTDINTFKVNDVYNRTVQL